MRNILSDTALNRHWISYSTICKEQKLRDVNYIAILDDLVLDDKCRWNHKSRLMLRLSKLHAVPVW